MGCIGAAGLVMTIKGYETELVSTDDVLLVLQSSMVGGRVSSATKL